MSDIRTRVSDALRSRLSPKGEVAVKDLASGIGRSGECVRKWMIGAADMKVTDLAAIARYLGDGSLLSDILGDLDQAPRHRFLWFTDTGAQHQAPAGHAAFVKRYLGLPANVPGNPATYVMRNLGWIALEHKGGQLIVEYDDRGIAIPAAQAASAWIRQHTRNVVGVTRRVLICDRVIAVSADPESVADALVRAAEIASRPQRIPWRVQRLRFNAVPEFMPAITAHHEAPHNIVEAVSRMGKLADCSLLRVRGDDVDSIVIGSAVPIPHSADLIGRNVKERSDAAYADVLHHQMIEATREPTLYHLRGSIYGVPVSYVRAALYAGDDTGLVVSMAKLRPNEEVYA